MQFGWWDIDVGRLALVNRVTGQKLSYRGEVAKDAGLDIVSTPNLQWMRLDYSDSQLSYPLLVQRRNVPDNLGARQVIWRVDHLRSARAWASKSGACEPHPPYDTWLRVDDRARDALACWPKSRQTGPSPDWIALEGGWRNGAWSTAFYRSFIALSDRDLEEQREATIDPSVPPLDRPAPSPWRFVPATGGDEGGTPLVWGFDRTPEGKLCLPGGRDLTAIGQDRPYLARKDRSAFLIPLELRPGHNFRQEPEWIRYFLRFLYVDLEMFSDAIEIEKIARTKADADAAEWSLRFNFRNDGLGAVRRDTSHSLIDADEVSASLNQEQPTGAPEQTWTPSNAIRHRLSNAVSTAMLDWQPSKLQLPVAGSEARQEITVPVAAMVNCYGIAIGGVAGTPGRLHTAGALLPNAAGRPHPLSHMFEEDDGVLRASQQTDLFGWWDYDPDATALVNRFSEQRIRFSGALGEHRDIAASEPGEPQWFRFDYSDRFVEFPVLARRRRRGLDGPFSGAWEVDYNRSLRLWQRETRKAVGPPTYGLWRRVHECLCDALVCWPELESTGEAANSVTTVGGWANGTWAELFRSHWNCDALKRRRTWASNPMPAYYGEGEEPIPEPLRAAARPAWRFFDAPVAERGASIDGLEIDRDEKRLALAPGTALQGFEHRVPFVRRDDGCAVLFPHGLYSHLFRGEDYSVEAEMLYADENTLALLREKWGQVSLTWKVQAKGFRNGSAEETEDLWRQSVEDRFGSSMLYPSLRLYRHLHQNLADAWLAWSGCDKRVLDDPAYIEEINKRDWFKTDYETSGFSLQRPNSIRFEGAYLGGLFFPHAAQTLTLRSATEEAAQAKSSAKAHAELQIMIDHLKTATRNTKNRRP